MSEQDRKPKATFEFPDFKIEFKQALTKEAWKRIKRTIDVFFETESVEEEKRIHQEVRNAV